jgi:hypothetical protein
MLSSMSLKSIVKPRCELAQWFKRRSVRHSLTYVTASVKAIIRHSGRIEN